MIFALLHATLGWALAALAALFLRRRSADARCWAWRLGLLKGPLALLLAVPIVIDVPPLPSGGEGLGVRGPRATSTLGSELEASEAGATHSAISANVLAKSMDIPSGWTPQGTTDFAKDATPRGGVGTIGAPSHFLAAPSSSGFLSPLPLSFFPLPYLTGLLAALAFRFAVPRRVRYEMPRVEGVFRPRVVIPEGLDPREAAMARAHEEAHVRRRDPLWSLVADLVCAALWFAPPVWLGARAMRAEAESACDAATLAAGASRRAYARLLLAHAGPAPANALGGPARRLAKRILMLERNPKPLSRSLAGALLALGLVGLLPWRAVASPSKSAEARRAPRLHELFPFRISLEDAMRATLNEPGVKARIAWTSAQDAALASREHRIASVMETFNDRQKAFARTHSQREANRQDDVERKEARIRAAVAGGPMPWTPEQQVQLKALALSKTGSPVWFDPEVSERLGLTLAQNRVLLGHERSVLDRLYLDPKLEKGYLLLPKAVEKRASLLEYRLYIASPGERPAIQRRLDELQRPYRRNVPHLTPAQRATRNRESVTKAWGLLVAEEAKAETVLTEDQRETLRRLQTDPDAWKRPYAVIHDDSDVWKRPYGVIYDDHVITMKGGTHREAEGPAIRFAGHVGRIPLNNTHYGAGQLWVSGVKEGFYDYTVKVAPPTDARSTRTAPVVAIPELNGMGIRASRIRRAGEETYLTADATLDGTRLTSFDRLHGSGRPVEIVTLKNGTTWRVYRDGTQAGFRYRIEKAVTTKPSPPKAPIAPKNRTSSMPRLLSRWSNLSIDGPLPGDEPGNVPIGVAHDPDGSIWTIYRARQSAPYVYALEHSTTAPGAGAKRLRYEDTQAPSFARDLRRRNPLPSRLVIDGRVWTIHPPSPERSAFPSSVEPLDHYASGDEPGTRGHAKERRRLAARPPIVGVEPWTEASIRRRLHLREGESLDFRPDPERPGEEVASLADREGIVDRNVVHRRRKPDGTFTYRVQAVVFVATKSRTP